MSDALPDVVVIVDVPALKVSAALDVSVVPKFTGEEEQATVLAPNDIVLVLLDTEFKAPQVKVYPAVSKEPVSTLN